LKDGGWTFGQQLPFNDPVYMQAITAFFAAVIVCQIANVFTSRTRKQSIFTKGILSNRYVLIGIASELLILSIIMYHPLAQMVFNTAPLDLRYIMLAVPFALLILVFDELRKYFIRKDVKIVDRFPGW
ncbi:MAG: cation-translocating P-type ATPase C-terminal domain-containing protein, partial [Methanosarcinaceae archaeon]|nr:cation-translocating P-type ATPase C-terminal domain-containing protein [Methanosarcinaceae archaeon]